MPCPELPLLFHLLENDPSPSRGDICSDKQLNPCFFSFCFFLKWHPSEFLLISYNINLHDLKLGVAVDACNPSTREVEAGASQV